MSTVLSGLQGLKWLVCLDDIFVFRETLKVRNDNLREVFARLRVHDLKLQPDKCEFLKQEITYLGHRLTPQGLFPDSDKVITIRKFPIPSNTCQLKRPYATFVFNTMPHSSTGFTPVDLLFVIKPNIPGVLQNVFPEIKYNYNSHVQELQSRLQSCYKLARANFRDEKEKNKEYYDRNTIFPLFVEGEEVLLHDEKVHCGKSVKLSQPWISPYKIVSIDDVNTIVILPRNKILKVHANRLTFWCRNFVF
jgi:hypothetical protein